MAHKIDPEKCVACGACEAACPQGAIKMAGAAYRIDQTNCVDCGGCLSECPNEAISAG